MPEIFEATADDIGHLGPLPLVMLMECLLENELASHGIPLSAAYVSLDINIRDGGEDGLVEWREGVPETNFFPRRRCLFQSKAGTLEGRDFTDELFKTKERNELKSRVKHNFDNDGAYILFYAGACVGLDADKRIGEMRDALTPHYPGKDLVIKIYDRSVIAKWTRQHVPAILKALRLAGKSGLESFHNWDDWAGFQVNRSNFVENEQTRRFISMIRSEMLKPKVALRIIGRSGLGKTRVAFEAFKPPERTADDSMQAILSGSVAYVDFLDEEHTVVNLVSQLRGRGAAGVIVVDNCPEDVHERLVDHITHENSRLSLLSIDYHIDASPEKVGVFRFEPSPLETIREMIRQSHPTLDAPTIDFIALYADGFPKVAALLNDVPLEEDVRLEPLNDRRLTDRLLRGRATMSEEAERVIEACALFVHLGFDGPVRRQRDYVADKICNLTPEQFLDRAAFFIPRVLDRIGDFVRVSPVPLAIRLAESYYDRRDADAHTRLFKDSEMPPELKDALGKRFKDLSTSERAEEVSRRLMGPTDPFGQAEVLNTEQGSLIFRSLAEVNPHVAMQTLEREFGNWSTDKLLELKAGRRNLVWALEMLVFNEGLFLAASRFLARLAVAENEKWSNNATGQFLHLFQPLLAGTEAAPPQRLQAIDELLASSDQRFVELGVEALGRVIGQDGGGRTMGAEQQRGRVLKDWYPATWGELFAYFDGAVERLTRYAARDDSLGEKARKLLAGGIRHLVHYQRFDSLDRALRTVVESHHRAWPEALEAVQGALRYELKNAPAEFVQRVRPWLDVLRPPSESEQIRLIVTVPPFGNIVEEDDGTIVDMSARAAADLAKTYAHDLNKWREILPLVSVDDQRQGFVFGQAIGETVDSEDAESYVHAALSALDNGGSRANPTVLCGLLLALKDSKKALVSSAISHVIENKDTAHFAAYLVGAVGLTESNLERLLVLLDDGILKPDDFRKFGYGRALTALNPDFVCAFLSRLLRFGLDGAYAALFVGYMFAKDENKQKWDACKPLFRDIASMDGIFEGRRETFDRYALQESAKDLLQGGEESQLAATLTEQILKVCRKHDLDFNAYEVMRPVFFVLLERYMQVVWPLVKRELADADSLTEWHLLHLFKRDMVMTEGPKAALLLLPDEEIKSWWRDNPEQGPRLVAASVPLYDYDAEVRVNPLVEALIDGYGSDKRVLSAITTNLGSFGFQGSLVPAYEQRLGFAKHFVNHRLPEVRQWANNLAAGFESEVRKEKKRDEEHEHGIWSARHLEEE